MGNHETELDSQGALLKAGRAKGARRKTGTGKKKKKKVLLPPREKVSCSLPFLRDTRRNIRINGQEEPRQPKTLHRHHQALRDELPKQTPGAKQKKGTSLTRTREPCRVPAAYTGEENKD